MTENHVTRICRECSELFSFVNSRGNARVYCSDGCSQKANQRRFFESIKGKCIVEGCSDTITRKTASLCEKHYTRLRRTGKLEGKAKTERKPNAAGYVAITIKGHPVVGGSGNGYEHRVVHYDAIGPGTHHCRWCGREVEWGVRGKRMLVVDHLNGIRSDNRPLNLVTACHRCNSARGLFQSWVTHHADDPFLWELYEKFKGSVALSS